MRSVGRIDVAPVGTALLLGSRVVWARLSSRFDDAEFGVETTPVGDRKNSRDQDLKSSLGPSSVALDPLWSRDTIRDCCLVGFIPSFGFKISGESWPITTPGRSNNSRSSFAVKAASYGPLRPIIETCLTVDLARWDNTRSGISYRLRSSGRESNIRAISRDTFPWPIIETCRALSIGGAFGFEGWFVYQWTTSRAGLHCSDGGRAG